MFVIFFRTVEWQQRRWRMNLATLFWLIKRFQLFRCNKFKGHLYISHFDVL